MKLFHILVLAVTMFWTSRLLAEDAAPAAPADQPSANKAAIEGTTPAETTPAPAASAPMVAAPSGTQPGTPAEKLPDVENLDFASGEVVTLDPATGKLDVKIYLDAAGNANEQTMSLTVDPSTEITNGETDLKTDALKAGAEIDVEYDVRTKKATYIFVY